MCNALIIHCNECMCGPFSIVYVCVYTYYVCLCLWLFCGPIAHTHSLYHSLSLSFGLCVCLYVVCGERYGMVFESCIPTWCAIWPRIMHFICRTQPMSRTHAIGFFSLFSFAPSSNASGRAALFLLLRSCIQFSTTFFPFQIDINNRKKRFIQKTGIRILWLSHTIQWLDIIY